MSSNVNKIKSVASKYTSNEQNLISLEQDSTFINGIISQLPEHFDAKVIENKDVMLYRLSDAEINFDKLCRTCLATTNVNYNFNDVCDGVLISTLLMQCTTISVQEDMMPKHICEACISELVNCYLFKKKCLQAQSTLKEIIKYSNARQGVRWNESTIQIPFLLNNLECTAFIADDKTTQQEIAQTENCEKQETTILDPNIKEILSEPDKKEENEITIQNKKEEEDMDYDRELSFGALNSKVFETDDIKIESVNEQIKCKLPLDCFRCGENFKTSEELENHRREVKHPKKRRKQPCHICGKVIASHHLTVHMRTHTKEKPYVCRICSKAFSLNCNLKRHFMTHTGEKPYICDFCGKGYIQASSLSEHICLHTGQKPLLCEICGKGFTYHGNLTEHKCVDPRVKSFKCSYCDKIFSQILEYQNHLQSHQITNQEIGQRLKELQCNVCKKVFHGRRTLNNHMRTHREKTYLCNHCGKGFSHNSSFQTHLKVHTGEKPNSCPECGKSFSQTGSLKSHMLIHSGQKPFKCKICSKSFTQRSHLGCHMKTHSGEKSYKCSYCNKRFALNGTLTVHIRTHTGETPYVCDVCGRGYYHSSTMKKHRRRHGHVRIVNKTSST